jgi:large subunit ribosomal protein L33
MAAPKRKIITLECTECKERNYSSEKNTAANAERIEINKFCPRCNKRTKHKETK